MIFIKRVLIILIWLVIVPFLTGIIPAFLFERNKKRIGTIYLSGWIFMTAIFQLLAVPLIIMVKTFTSLVNLYTLAIGFLSVASLIFLIVRTGFNSLYDYFELPDIKKIDKASIFLWIIFAITYLFQIVMSIIYMTPDGDDAYYVVHALIADQKDYMYIWNAYTGKYNSLEYRHVLAPFSMFIAFIARKSGIHATIVAHSILPGFFISISYLIYYKIGHALLPFQKSKQAFFMVIISGIQIWGASSVYTKECFMLSRTWQGKSILANIIIPFAFYLIINLCRQTEKGETHRYRLWGIFILLFLTNISAALTSSLGLLLLLIFESVMIFLIAIRNKSFLIFLKSIFVYIPCFAYMLLYVIMK